MRCMLQSSLHYVAVQVTSEHHQHHYHHHHHHRNHQQHYIVSQIPVLCHQYMYYCVNNACTSVSYKSYTCHQYLHSHHLYYCVIIIIIFIISCQNAVNKSITYDTSIIILLLKSLLRLSASCLTWRLALLRY